MLKLITQTEQTQELNYIPTVILAIPGWTYTAIPSINYST